MAINKRKFSIPKFKNTKPLFPGITGNLFPSQPKLRAYVHMSSARMPNPSQKRSRVSLAITPHKSQTVTSRVLTKRVSLRSPGSSKQNSLFSLKKRLSRSKTMILKFPMTSALAFATFSEQFSEYEKREILNYNDVYYLGTISRKTVKTGGPNNGFDEPDGSYTLYKGDHLAYRYEILDILGAGSFGKVCKAFDHKSREQVAIKIIKNANFYRKQAQVEISTLETLQKWDLNVANRIVRMKNYFTFREHICISFELMHVSLFDKLRAQEFQGMTQDPIKPVIRQILVALQYMRKHGIIHCDLKPENILFESSKEDSIKVIDLGSACSSTEKIYNYIQSRFYRAPEIILGAKYSVAIDMWSLGCIVHELHTGNPLFPGSTESEQIKLFLEVLGVPPESVLKKSTRSSHYFDDAGKPTQGGTVGTKELLDGDPEMKDFISKCLEWDPKLRMTPTEGLAHFWLN